MLKEHFTILAGGVGGARMAHGFYLALPEHSLNVIVNTGDDFTYGGLKICPDLDTNLYTLAGKSHPQQGWGLNNETYACQARLQALGLKAWFALGDQDLATSLLRTHLLQTGSLDPVCPPNHHFALDLTAVTQYLADQERLHARLLPMCNEVVPTIVHTPNGDFPFQEYFVLRHHRDPVTGFTYQGCEKATLSEPVTAAINNAHAIIIAPSNPFVSILPILAVPGLKNEIERCSARKLAISPLIGNQAIKGPLAAMMQSLGLEVSSLGIARLYAGLIDDLIIDVSDQEQAASIAQLGISVTALPILMSPTASSRQQLAEQILNVLRNK